MDGYHKSVLLTEVLEGLEIKKGGWYLDCTLGDGGYSLGILENGGNVLGLDQDPEAIDRAKDRIKNEELRIELVRGNFGNLKDLVGDQRFDGVVFDLGVSSLQLEKGERGFSLNKESELDMRMDPNLSVKAADLVNGLNKGELRELLLKLGEITDKRIVEAIVKAREEQSITKTTELAKIVEKAVGRNSNSRIHPATQVFQALRIAVNDELNSLKSGLKQAEERLNQNGRLLVVSFHSLEDRIVKNQFREWEQLGIGQASNKPITPTENEIRNNPRSRSAKLRIFKKAS